MAVPALSQPGTAAGWVRSNRRGLLIIVALWAIASLVVAFLALDVVTPRRYIDEFLYWGVAKSLAGGDGFSWRGTPLGGASWLYPMLIAPAFKLAGSVSSQYDLVKIANSVLICSVVFPVYVAARWFAEERLAVLAAVFALAVPALNYAGIVGTESLAYPLCAAAFVGMLHALARPGLTATLVALGLMLLAVLTRFQFVVLLPIFGAALVLVALMRPPGERAAYLRAQRALVAVLVALVLLGALYLLIRGRGALGIYATVTDQAAPTWGDAFYWLKAFAADTYLLSAIVPAIATFALLGSRTNRRDPLVGSLAALALVASIAFVLQMTWFSMINEFHWREQHIFYERYMFYLGPLFFVGLMASFGRISWKAAAGSLAVALLIVAGMQSDAVAVPFSIDAFGQAYLGFFLDTHDSLLPHIGIILAGLTLLLGLALVASAAPKERPDMARYGRTLAIVLPLFVLVISQAKAWSYQQIYSESLLAQEPVPLDWVSRATPQPVGMLLASDADPTTFFQTEFWNPNVDRAYVSPISPIDSREVHSPACLFRALASGRILPAAQPGCSSVPSAWLVESGSFSMHLRGENKRVHASTGAESTLMISPAPAQVLSMVGGRNVRTGVVESVLTVRTYSLQAGQVRIVTTTTRSPSVAAPSSGEKKSLAPGKTATFGYKTVPGTQLQRLSLPGGGTAQNKLKVIKIEFREGDGPWRSIT